MQVVHTNLEGVVVLVPSRFGDSRGFFSETWNKAQMEKLGLHFDFVQDNHSLSVCKDTVRGLHFQSPPRAQSKLVRCGKGRLFDVAVDIRKGSPTYAQWTGIELSFENGRQLLIPAGFLHGFATLEADSEIIYKCSDYYAPETEGALRWDDPDIGIKWPLTGPPVLSEKDAAAPLLAGFNSPFTFKG